MNAASVSRAATASAAVLLLTSCGSLPREMDFLSRGDEFLEQSPRSIAKAAFANMREVTSMRVLGSQETNAHGFTRIDLRLDDTSCTGTLDSADGTIRVLKNAEGAWFSADDDFWRTQAGSSPQADQAVGGYAGRWSAIGRKNPLLDLCHLDALLEAFALDDDDTVDTIKAGEVGEVGDKDAVPVTGQEGKEQITAWVSVQSPHRVLKVAPAEDPGRPDTLYFEEFGTPVVADSPDKKDVVTLPVR